MYRLLAAWANDAVPDGLTAPEIDFERLWQIADRHSLTAAVCMALEKADLLSQCPPSARERFSSAKLTSVRRRMLMDAEREKLLAFLEEQGIWYMPLKGVILQDFYPELGARQMSDNDILFDASCKKTVREYMMQNGYQALLVGKGAHDVYHKPPLYAFEMHRTLFAPPDSENAYRDTVAQYYENVKDRLVKDSDDRYGWHFTDEDYYVFFLAHAFKHYDRGGTGVRTLLDVWMYRRKKTSMNEDHIDGELEKLGILDFERCCRSLSGKLFDWPPSRTERTTEEREMLRWMEESGVYGTKEHHVQRDMDDMLRDGVAIDGRTKWRYLLRQLFPSLQWYRVNVPFCYRHRWTIPFYWVLRLVRCVLFKWEWMCGELSAILGAHSAKSRKPN